MSNFHNKLATYIKEVSLKVLDLDKSIKFYKEVLGFSLLYRDEEEVKLGFTNPLLTLKKAKTANEIKTSGLYHIAYLVPNRVDLANWLYYHLQHKTVLDGASNHGVSEAIYLHDNEGNGIEIYTDTKTETWSWKNGHVEMVTIALDLDDLFETVTNPTNKLPDNTIIGHIHLSVIDLDKSKSFYNLLGFNTTQEMRSAAFLSSQKYHHHIGMNIWHMDNAAKLMEEQAGLDYFVIQYPTINEMSKVLSVLDKNKYDYHKENDFVSLTDVNGINIHLKH